MRYLYGLFADMPNAQGVYTPRFALLTNKRRALHFAKIWHGYVGAIPRSTPGSVSYDAPTFQALMDLIADFRAKDAKDN